MLTFRFWVMGFIALIAYPVLIGMHGAVQANSTFLDKPALKARVSQSGFLPRAMYGTWNIKATVLRTTAPTSLFYPDKNELWTLSRDENGVTLQNIANQAAASVTVDEVQGNTATFHHSADFVYDMTITETPTITVNGNTLIGINRQTIYQTHNGKSVPRYQLEIQLEGERIAGPQFNFQDKEDIPLQLQVEPLRHQ